MKAKDQPSCVRPVAPIDCLFGSVRMLKYDWLKIVAMHVFAKSLAVAALIMADMLVSWTFLTL